MINEIKNIIQNYINNAKLCDLMTGTVTADGIRISNILVLPNEFILGNLKDFVTVGDRVRLIRKHGGKQFYIVEIIGAGPALKGMTLSIEPIVVSIPDGGGTVTINSIKINEVSL